MQATNQTETGAGRSQKVRKPPKRGVRRAAQAFCDVCGWRGAHWYGDGAMGNAHGELRWHRESTKCN